MYFMQHGKKRKLKALEIEFLKQEKLITKFSLAKKLH